MKIFSDGILISEFEDKQIYDDAIGTKIVGVNLYKNSKGKMIVEPVYQSKIRWEKNGRILYIELAGKNGNIGVFLTPWFPFVHFERFTAELEERNDDD
ncbi:MAG: hypothetical protein KQI81_09045 [Deltaproteobacteria bacterium]|nr:hypothetical protein [Deltaproteobacteria bacterium]